MRIFQLLLILASTMLSTQYACASDQFIPLAQVNETDSRAKIVLLRSDSFAGAVNGADVLDGQISVGSVSSGGYLLWEREPGTLKLVVRKAGLAMTRASGDLEMETQAGEVYFVFAEPIFMGPYKLRLLEKNEGELLMGKYKPPSLKQGQQQQ